MLTSPHIREIIELQKVVSDANAKLLVDNSPIYLTSTLAFNYLADHPDEVNYYDLWVGFKGGNKLHKLYASGTLYQVCRYISETTHENWIKPTKSKVKQLFQEIKES